jgi:peptide/nickel transport system ATP-binding protein
VSDPVLSIRNLNVGYGESVHAVRDVSLELERGHVLGVAGESGCGKSTLAYAVNRLLQPPGKIISGSVTFHPKDGAPVDVLALEGENLRTFRWRRIAMVFQSAMNTLNPVLTIRRQLGDVLSTHQPSMSRRQREERSRELLHLVGIDARRIGSYPHELSGGMRQRVLIAMALALNPDVVVLDEPTTALDVVVQRDILTEIDRLREVFGFAVIFITHDLSLLLEISDHLAIMYGGRVVEYARARDILNEPRHPYTIGLLNSFPSLRGQRQALHGIPGSPPDLSRTSPGCSFAPRCPYAFAACHEAWPQLALVQEAQVACLQYDPAHNGGEPDKHLLERRFEAKVSP